MSTITSIAAQRASNSEDDLENTVERSPGTITPKGHAPVDDQHALLHSLPPPPPFDLSIEDLSIGVPPPQHFLPLPVPIPVPRFLGANRNDDSDKTIICNVSASCGSGEILALIGGSGSGKSTLLTAIVNRLANLPIRSGEIKYIPKSVSRGDQRALLARQMKDKIGFVPQNDYLLPNLTVRETLDYAAALRLPGSISKETCKQIVDLTIEELGLKDAADIVIGGFGGLRKGISGGERRRVTIACILVSLPSIIVLDEPTSGLDAFSAYQLLLTLSRLAKRNRTIVLSLHQPRSDAFALFTRILLLSKGSVVYSGLTRKCLPWFKKLGEEPERGTNPLDFLIDISSVEIGEDEKLDASRARVQRLVRAWKERGAAYAAEPSMEQDVNGRQLEKTGPEQGQPETIELESVYSGHGIVPALRRPGLIAQTRVLTRRAFKNAFRNYGQTFGFAFQSIVIGLLLGISFFRLGETPTDIQSLKTICYQHLPGYFYLTVVYGIYRYCETGLVVFDRERADHLYKVFPWVISEIISNLPINVGFTSLFATILYFMCNLRTDNLVMHLLVFIAECSLVQLGSTAFALMVASLVRVFANASLLANGLSIFFLLTTGYLLLQPPLYVAWIKYISVYWYGFRIIAIDQLRGRVFACEGVTGTALNQCQGDRVLAGLLIPVDDPLSKYFGGLLGLFVGFNTLAGIILSVWHPGGVRHAAQIDGPKGKESLKTILRDINFQAPAGQITAILGPSGAGKSSLLQLLAARSLNAGPLAYFRAEGSITFNGAPRTSQTASTVAYVEQEDDYHLPALTVRETLRYAAILRLPRTMSRKSKIARAEEVMHMLGLSDCANSLVGGPLLKGISGGEKRRLSLAVEMINDPAVLIVDEVTSGLDASTANSVMKGLKQIAESGRTVIVTLHQPRSDIYHLLDNLVVLVKGGQMVYTGPLDTVEPTFQLQGHAIPENFNPADFLLDVVSVDNRPQFEKETRARVNRLVEFWNIYKRKRVHASGEEREEPPQEMVSVPQQGEVENRMTPMWVSGPVVLERMIKNMWRQQPVFWVRIQQTPMMGILFWLFYQRLKNGASGGQDRIGLMQEMATPLPFVGLLNSVATFPSNRNLFFHEYRSRAAYSTATFLLAVTIIEVPFTFIACLLFALIMNVGAGMQTSARIYFEFVAATFAIQNNGESIGIIFASFTNSMGLSVSLVSTILSILCQFSGIVSLSIPHWVATAAWGTTMKIAGRIIVINESVGLQLHCTQDEITSGECLVQNGEELLRLFGWKDLDTGTFVGLLFACAIGWRLLAWVALMIRMRGW